MFHVGQHVVCVDDRVGVFDVPGVAYNDERGLDGLRRGVVYTIRAVGDDGVPSLSKATVWLAEIQRPPSKGWGETGYAAERFRPVDETKLAIFKAMLVSPPKETVTIG